MKRLIPAAVVAATCVAAAIVMPCLFAQNEGWDLMTQNEMGLDRFREAYPDFDGKGVVIAVLDTGVDMGVAGLTELPGGGVKVVDVRDFSGEGDLTWEDTVLVPDADLGERLVDPEGRSLVAFRDKVEGALDGRFYIAFLEEAAFADTPVKDLNADGDNEDVFGLLIFAVKEEDKLRYEAVVDVNGDGKLDDGVRLTDYYRQHQTFTLAGKEGGRRQLTMALNFYPEEKRVSVHFDDGGHGTHVAGIAAGYSVHGQKGYNGGAPGAKVISLKIGNNRFAGGCTVTESVKKAYEYGARYAAEHKVPVVFNMSFGVGSEREGRSAVDKFVDDLLWKNPGVVAVVSAGNEGPGLSSIGTPSCSKRAIAVGALLSPEAAAAQYGSPELEDEVFFSFSSRGGDTYKPDVVAPGSAASTVPPWSEGDLMQGTSMASPAAAGAIACLVDGLVRHDPPLEVDNGIVLRAVKNTGRSLEGWTWLDYGGGVLDLPAAYGYACRLYAAGEQKILREYRVTNDGPAAGDAAAYWRSSPYLPGPTDMMSFRVEAGFPESISDEAKARFYRAFDLKPDVNWLTLNKPLCYLKGSQSADVGVLADLTGRPPGVYTGRVHAYARGDTAAGDEPQLAFSLPVTVVIPHRIAPDNRGTVRAAGQVDTGFLQRFFVEVPAGASAIDARLRFIDGPDGARLAMWAFDPEGIGRGVAGARSEGDRAGAWSAAGESVVPGTWEFVVTSSTRSPGNASFDVAVTLSGLDLADPEPFFGADTARSRMLVPVRCTQPVPFGGTVSGRLDGFVKKEVVVVKDAGEFTRTLRLDKAASSASWTVEFDRDTYALFTDVVLRVEDAESDETLRNSALSQRSSDIGIAIPKEQTTPKEYRLVVRPAFTNESDTAEWRFILTERLTWSTDAIPLEPLSPPKGRLELMPWDWAYAEFALAQPAPAAPPGYIVEGELEAHAGGGDLIARRRFVWH